MVCKIHIAKYGRSIVSATNKIDIVSGSGQPVNDDAHVINADTCTRCGICMEVCKPNAILKLSGDNNG